MCDSLETSWLENTKNVVLILTPIATFFLAFFTVNKWKKEYKAKAYFECSFKFLKAAYTLRDEFRSMRSPMHHAWEMLPKTEENKENYNRENIIYSLNKRQKTFQEALNNFYAVFPEVEVLLGKEVVNVAWDINHIVTKYYMAVNEYIQLFGVTNNHDHFAEVSAIVYSTKTPDKIRDEMDSNILKIEAAVSKHLDMKV